VKWANANRLVTTDNKFCASKLSKKKGIQYTKSKTQCVVPENSHTSPTEGISSNTSPPLWKFQLTFIDFFKFFGLIKPAIPQEIPIPRVGRVGIFSGTTHCRSELFVRN